MRSTGAPDRLEPGLRRDVASQAGLQPVEALPNLTRELSDAVLATLAEQARAAKLLRADAPDSAIRHLFDVYCVNACAALAYEPPTIARRAVLVQAATGTASLTDDNVATWQRIFGDALDIRTLPGGHHTLLHPPYVAAVADLLNGYLGTATLETSTSSAS